MAVRRTKVKEGENLTDSNKEKVLALLNPTEGKPITKVVACEILNITYNTTRLNRILEEYSSDQEFKKTRRKQMRGVPVDNATASQIVSGYLSGTSLADISAKTFRSTNIVKNILNKYNVPIRNTSVDYFNPIFVDSSVDDYVEGDLVYLARYDQPGTIRSTKYDPRYGMVYTIWLHDMSRRVVTQPYYELADLRLVQTELNIEMQDLPKDEVNHLLAEGMKNQKKQEDKRK